MIFTVEIFIAGNSHGRWIFDFDNECFAAEAGSIKDKEWFPFRQNDKGKWQFLEMNQSLPLDRWLDLRDEFAEVIENLIDHHQLLFKI